MRAFPHRDAFSCRAFRFVLLFVIGFVVLEMPAAASGQYWLEVSTEIGKSLQLALDRYRDGDKKAAKREVTKAYFSVFEGKKMEAAMRMEQGAKYTYRVERQFGALRKAINREASHAEFQQGIETLIDRLQQDAAQLDRAGIPPEVFQTGR